MASLTGTKIKDTYDALLKVSDNGALDGTLQTITDGLGNNSALSLSTAGASVGGTLAVSGNAAFDTNTLFVDAANNRVSIGTTTAQKSLHIESSDPTIRLSDSNSTSATEVSAVIEWYDRNNTARAGYLGFPSSGTSDFTIKNEILDGDISFAAGDVERMRLDSSGDISFRDSSANEAFYWDASAASLGIGGTPITTLTARGYISTTDGTRTAYFGSDGEGILLGSTTNHYLRFLTNNTERMRIDSSGNVGIGGTRLTAYGASFRTLSIQTPAGDNASILELVGNRSASDGNQNGMIQFWNKTSTAVETARISGDQASAVNSGNITFLTASAGTLAERMRIDSSGNVLIGATSPVSTRRELRIGGNDGGSRISLGLQGNNASALYVDSGYNLVLANEYNDAAIKVLVINYNNGVYLSQSATSWTANSDERLKNINGSIDGALEKLNTLRAVNFSWKDDDSQKENLGLIAQDVEQVFPQVIDRNKKISKDEVEVDETEYLGVRYTELIPVLIAAIQELNAKVESLEAQLNA